MTRVEIWSGTLMPFACAKSPTSRHRWLSQKTERPSSKPTREGPLSGERLTIPGQSSDGSLAHAITARVGTIHSWTETHHDDARRRGGRAVLLVDDASPMDRRAAKAADTCGLRIVAAHSLGLNDEQCGNL